MISLKNPGQIAKMREAGKILREVEDEVREAVRPGVTTAELDVLAERLIRKHRAIPSSLHYEGYPCSICASLNDEVVHGIPSDRRVLKEGDILSVDCTLLLDGWQADSAFTVGVGTISEEAEKLIRVTEECFWKAVRLCVAGNRLGDVGHAVQAHAEANGCTPIREFTGHGIGRAMHEDPAVYNYGEPGKGMRLREGMTLAVEPMIAPFLAGSAGQFCPAFPWGAAAFFPAGSWGRPVRPEPVPLPCHTRRGTRQAKPEAHKKGIPGGWVGQETKPESPGSGLRRPSTCRSVIGTGTAQVDVRAELMGGAW